MRQSIGSAIVAAAVAVGLGHAQTLPPPPVTVQDCTKLKGSSKKDCLRTNGPNGTTTAAPSAKDKDPFPFPEDQSKGVVPGGTADMPTGEPDPPASSLKPMQVPGADADPPSGSSSSSSSSSNSSSSSSSSQNGAPTLPPDDDAPPTTAGSDTPIVPGALKDLGSRGDSSQRGKSWSKRVWTMTCALAATTLKMATMPAPRHATRTRSP